MRICSLVPSVTETVCALGLTDELVGVSHECDYPEFVKSKPKLTKSAISSEGVTSAQIDAQVRESFQKGKGIYELDFEMLKSLEPDIIFTQKLCQVCAVSYGEVYTAASKLSKQPKVISIDTFTLQDILSSIVDVGRSCNELDKARKCRLLLESRIAKVRQEVEKIEKRTLSSKRKKKKVFFLEWTDPIMCSGHWVPELIEIAGGEDGLGQPGRDSIRVDWGQVRDYSPDYLIVAPCGFDVQRAERETKLLSRLEGWYDLPAVNRGNVYAADGSAYFSRPGPRIVDGLEILAMILHPEIEEYRSKYDEKDFRQVNFKDQVMIPSQH